jgi:hypothetical protein
MAAMTRTRLFLIAGAMLIAAVVSLVLGVMQISADQDVESYISGHYQQYASDPNAARYTCSGNPSDVADDIEDFQDSESRASDANSEYLRYDDNIVVIGPDGGHPCTVRVEDIDGGYSHGSYIFLGPGFHPGSPDSSSGGSSGGPGGVK